MADSFVRVPTDSTGKRVDATSLDVGADTVYRQRIVIGDNSATAQFAVVTGGALVCTGTFNISAMPTVTVTGGVAISGTAVVSGNVNISTMPAITLAAGQVLDSISATVGVKGQVSLGPGTSNIGTINDISRTVQVAIGTPFTLQGISTTVTVAGNVNISATATAIIGAVLDSVDASPVRVGDSANTAIRVNVVAGSSGGVSQVDGTTYSTQAANFVPIGGVFDDAATNTLSENDAGAVRLTTNRGMHTNLRTDGGVAVEDSANAAIRVNVVAGSSGGVSQVDGTTFSTQAANFVPIGGIFDDTAPDTLSENDAGVCRVTTNRALHVNLRTANGNEITAGNALSVKVELISATASVVLAAGAANVGTINNISATVAITGTVALVAGTVINNISATVIVAGLVSLGAGTANIGSINNISATVIVAGEISAGASLSTINKPVLIGGNDSAGGAGGIARTLLLDTSGRIILGAGAQNIGTINNISATVLVAGVVSLGAGTAVIGDLNAISRTVQVAVGTPFTLQGISTTVQVAVGTPFIIQGISTTVTVVGNINISATATVIVQGPVAHSLSVTAGVQPLIMGGRAHTSASAAVANLDATYAWLDVNGRQVIVQNHPSLLPSASHGPKCVTASTSAGVALIAAPGAGLSIYITSLACTNGSSTLTRADVFAASQTASCIAQMYMAASGGGFVLKYDPPVKVTSNTGVTCRVDPNVSQAIFNVHFYVGPE